MKSVDRVGGRTRRRWPVLLWLMALHFFLTVRLVIFVSRHSVNVPFGDDWGYLTPLFRHEPLWKVFLYQHAVGREGVGLVLDKFLLDWTDWNLRAAAIALVFVMSVTSLLALVLKKRLFGRLEWADAILLFLFLGLGHFEVYLNSPNPSPQVFPLFLAVLYGLCWTLRWPVVRVLLVAFVNFLMIFCQYGFFMGLLTPVLLATLAYRHYRQGAIRDAEIESLGLLVALFSLASFFLGYNPWSPGSCFIFPYHPLYTYPWYLSLMFANMLELKGHGFLPTTFGAALVVLLIVTLWLAGRKLLYEETAGRDLVIVSLAGFSLLLSASATVGRICLPLDFAQSSRYLAYVVPAFMAFYFWLVSAEPARWRSLTLAGYLIVAAYCGLTLTAADRGGIYWLTSGKQSWRSCYLKYEDLARCNSENSLPLTSNPEIAEKLKYLKQNRLSLYANH